MRYLLVGHAPGGGRRAGALLCAERTPVGLTSPADRRGWPAASPATPIGRSPRGTDAPAVRRRPASSGSPRRVLPRSRSVASPSGPPSVEVRSPEPALRARLVLLEGDGPGACEL